MKRRLLLVSNSTLHGGGYLDHCQRDVSCFFGGGVRRVLFVPYALHDRDAYTKTARDRFHTLGYEVDGIHEAPDPVDAVRKAEAIFIGGGNTFRLLKSLYDNQLVSEIRRRVLEGRDPLPGLQRRDKRRHRQHQHHQRHAHRLPPRLQRHRPRPLQHQPPLPGPRPLQPPHGGDPGAEDHPVPRGTGYSVCSGAERGFHAAGGGEPRDAAGNHQGETLQPGTAYRGV